ncbi:DNA helicase IV [Pseudoalteromonas luteoviolacea B = ATCC 29581]|nr:DNA helicase IV [Pseudoalteromonas luteoviolacea B = ATCC 29581]
MHSTTLMPSKYLRWLVRWQKVIVTEDGLTVILLNKTLSYPWQSQAVPPSISSNTPLSSFTVWDEHGAVSFYCPNRERLEFIKQYQSLWSQVHGPRICLQANRIEKKLAYHYLTLQTFNELKAFSISLLKPWKTWWRQAQLEKALVNALETLEEISDWSLDDAEQFKQAFEGHYLTEFATFFDNIESQPLTRAQRLACIRQEKCQLLLAAAGSGKTSVMIARAGYLVAARFAQPAEILLLAFGNDAANEMQTRLANNDYTNGIKAQTFHSLALMIVSKVEGKAPTVTPLCTDQEKKLSFFAQCALTISKIPQHLTLFRRFIERHELLIGKLESSFGHGEIRTWLESRSGKLCVRLIVDMVTTFKEFRVTEPVEKLHIAFPEDYEFISLFFTEYQWNLQNSNSIDFTDMLDRAISYLESGKYIAPWCHLLVDEFQDISRSRAKLLHMLQGRGKFPQLFAVGDDWQAIYRFSGSDLTFTTKFTQKFANAKVFALDKTFRFHERLLRVSSDFVTRNPTQCVKALNSMNSEVYEPVKLLSHGPDAMDSLSVVIEQLQCLANDAKVDRKTSVLFVARFSKDLPTSSHLKAWLSRFNHFTFNALTVHAAKGQEADYCFVMGLRSGLRGFPCSRPVAPFLDALLPECESYPHAEERRLFYVALTRARKQTILFYDALNPSEFISEMRDSLDSEKMLVTAQASD